MTTATPLYAAHSAPRESIFVSATSLVGRVLLALVFVPRGLSKIGEFSGTAEYMASKGMPMVGAALTTAILFEVFFGLCVLLGFKVRIAVAGLVLFLVLATYYYHNPLAVDAAQRQAEMIQLFKNAAIAGGLLMVAARGPGCWSIDGRRA